MKNKYSPLFNKTRREAKKAAHLTNLAPPKRIQQYGHLEITFSKESGVTQIPADMEDLRKFCEDKQLRQGVDFYFTYNNIPVQLPPFNFKRTLPERMVDDFLVPHETQPHPLIFKDEPSDWEFV